MPNRRASHWAELTLLLALVTPVACAPRFGGQHPRWQRVDTAHFTVYTDLAAEPARERAVSCEQLLSALHQHGWEATGEPPLRMSVVMFADPSDFHAYGGYGTSGYATHALFGPLLVLPAPRHGVGYATLAHELTHGLAYQAMAYQPRWFSEGLASYFESAAFEGEHQFVLGRPPAGAAATLRERRIVPPSRLIAGEPVDSEHAFYASSWALVHYLMTEHADAFADFQGRLAAGVPGERAFREAFPQLGMAQLDADVAQYVGRGSVPAFVAPVQVSEVAATQRTLSRAEELGLEAVLWSRCHACDDGRARSDKALAAALAEQPHQLEASVLALADARVPAPEAMARARALTEAHPEAWLAWAALVDAALRAQVALPNEGDTSPMARLRSIGPRHPFSWLLSARQAALRGDPASALAYAERARRLAPGDTDVLFVRAQLFAALGDCAALQSELTLLEGHELSREGRTTLAGLQQQCAR